MPSFMNAESPSSQEITPPTSTLTKLITGANVREASRNGTHTTTTSGLAPTYLQANLIILPSRYADDFRLLCKRNPVPCPVMAESEVGKWGEIKSCIPGLEGEQVVSDVDLRRDAPKYMVYQNGKVVKSECPDIIDQWTMDHVAFLLGCSFSFESALTSSGLPPRHAKQRRNVPMYRTTIPLCPAGVFTKGTYVVSMRPYKLTDIKEVRDITREYTAVHGEPLDWGWDAVARLGIKNIDVPEWGDMPLNRDGCPLSWNQSSLEENAEVPVFWGCGVTPQEAVMKADLKGTIMAHAPGHMLVLDCRDWDILTKNDKPRKW